MNPEFGRRCRYSVLAVEKLLYRFPVFNYERGIKNENFNGD